MKKLLNLTILLFITTIMFAQTTNTSFISTYHLREKIVNSNIRSIVIITIDNSINQIQVQNFVDGVRTSRTLVLAIDKKIIKNWNQDGDCLTYYCHTVENDAIYGQQKAILYVTNTTPIKIILGVFNDEISVIKYKFRKD